MNCTYIHTDKTDGKKTPCCRTVFGKGKFCIFHSPELSGKATAFGPALAEILTQASSLGKPSDLD